MPAGLKRIYGKGHLHFITFSCYRRLPLLKTARARDVLVKELGKIRDEMGFPLAGYVVMPEHVHLLIGEPKAGAIDFATEIETPRGAGAARKEEIKRCGANAIAVCGGGESSRAFWQARFYDFNVYTRGKIKEKLNYMHANPVVRGLVAHPKDWPWSSWGFYWGRGTGPVKIDLVR